MKIEIPDNVEFIIEKLEEAGYEAYAVGGCVRDSILKRNPSDWDITTSAFPSQVKSIFKRTVDTGIKHGTVTVLLGKQNYEVTAYRIDGDYIDGRHPESVEFTANLTEDLKRRDFTINAMAYNRKKGLVDIFGGCQDLENKIVRCVGDAKERFTEDALRVMRAVRFAAQLGFEIESDTKAAITLLAPNLAKVSGERIQVELVKLLMSDYPELFLTLYETGITRIIMPEFDVMMATPQRNPYHCYTVGMHTIKALENIKSKKILRLAILFHDMGKPYTHAVTEEGTDIFWNHSKKSMEMAKCVLKRLKFDNETTADVIKLIQYHDYHFTMEKKSVRKAMSLVGERLFLDLLDVMRADTKGKSDYRKQERLDQIDEIESMYYEIIRDKECFTLKQLSLNGSDLIKLGYKPGRQIGELLSEMLEYVIEYPDANNKEMLLTFIEKSVDSVTDSKLT